MFLEYSALIASFIVTTSAFAQSASADILNAKGEDIGTAQIQSSHNSVRINVHVSHLPPGTYGIHIHNVGKCDGPAFASAGSHLNPTSKEHGKDNPERPHAGDLLNLQVKADGPPRLHLSRPKQLSAKVSIRCFTTAELRSLPMLPLTTTKLTLLGILEHASRAA